MMSKDNNLSQRAIDAAKAYLERAGIIVIDHRVFDGKEFLVGMENDEAVVILVEYAVAPDNVPEFGTSEALVKAVDFYYGEERLPKVRGDEITLYVIAEDRALLRHNRSSVSSRGGIDG